MTIKNQSGNKKTTTKKTTPRTTAKRTTRKTPTKAKAPAKPQTGKTTRAKSTSKKTTNGSEATQFQPGNTLWQLAKNPGRPKSFNSPDEMWQKALEYFQWCTENPLEEIKAFQSNGKILQTSIPKMRAFTIQGFRIFTGIGHQTWANYKEKPEYLEVIKDIEEVIYENKFTGASAGFLNQNIIARDLGLVDQKKVETPEGNLMAEFLDELKGSRLVPKED
jgi:hypothetical protein